MILLLLMSLCGCGGVKKECRDAYADGYYVGWSIAAGTVDGTGKMCNLGYKYYPHNDTDEKFEWVGIGNEKYDDDLEELTGRNYKKYWWAE